MLSDADQSSQGAEEMANVEQSKYKCGTVMRAFQEKGKGRGCVACFPDPLKFSLFLPCTPLINSIVL